MCGVAFSARVDIALAQTIMLLSCACESRDCVRELLSWKLTHTRHAFVCEVTRHAPHRSRSSLWPGWCDPRPATRDPRPATRDPRPTSDPRPPIQRKGSSTPDLGCLPPARRSFVGGDMPSVALRQPRPPRFDSHAHRGPCQTRVLSTSTGAFCLCSCSDGQLGRRRGLRRSRADPSRTLARASFSSHAVRSTHLCLTRSRQPCFRALAARREYASESACIR